MSNLMLELRVPWLGRVCACFLLLTGAAPLLGNEPPLVEPGEFRRPDTESEQRFWLENMVWHHRYSMEEIGAVTGWNQAEIQELTQRFGLLPERRPSRPRGAPVLALPYPGGRHPRIGFRDGAIRPQRETKVSLFPPWPEGGYVVVDVPEAIWSQDGLLYLAHTHVPTVWTKKGITLPPLEWERPADGTLRIQRQLPNGVRFGAKVIPDANGANMELWLTNGSKQLLTDLRVQNCVMLREAKGFAIQGNDNKVFQSPYVACRSEHGNRWIVTAWEPCHRPWANPPCPCLHSDPKFPDAAPGATVRVRGKLWFLETNNITDQLRQLDQSGWRHPQSSNQTSATANATANAK